MQASRPMKWPIAYGGLREIMEVPGIMSQNKLKRGNP
jgi:hypothetical protein